ncbi:MAG TPA: hypothetical protein P5338_05895, partial [Bacteroidales bacterium]|nr:hypothetical protein [Bacteroidales bacterium]
CMKARILLLLFAFLSVARFSGRAQELVRLELEASDLSLPYYTIPVAQKGVIVFRATETNARRASGWELLHYDTGFQPVEKKRLDIPSRLTFAGWEVNDSFLVLLFLAEPPGIEGRIAIYHLDQKSVTAVNFEVADLRPDDLFLLLSGDIWYFGGTILVRKSGAKRGNTTQNNLFLLTGSCTGDTFAQHRSFIPEMTEIAHIQTDEVHSGLLLAARVSTGKYQENMEIRRISREGFLQPMPMFTVDFRDKYPVDITFSNNSGNLVLTGTYGIRQKKSWKNNSQVMAEGVFYQAADSTVNIPRGYYPFSNFGKLPVDFMKVYFEKASGNSQRRGDRNSGYRMLLHDNTYTYKNQSILVAEAYYPEYEYENRTQFYSSPYSYYGYYYPGYYDNGSRWVFKGFRYAYAIVAAFDSAGGLTWENAFETSNILDRNLTARLTVKPIGEEVVLVYAFDGKIWYRVLTGNEVIVDKESIPVELLSPSERIRENQSMYLSQWYNRYFLVWGRHTIVNNDGRSRTVYYCNKLAFE